MQTFPTSPAVTRHDPSGTNRATLDFDRMRGRSPAMRRLYHEIEQVAATDAVVLILGQSGTGKELVARSLHERSRRSSGPFVAVNCGAIPAGLIEAELFGHERGSFTGAHQQHAGFFERAAGGTLFLDEISEMPVDMQVRLLRVLESRCFRRVGGHEEISTDARIVAASNRDLVAAAATGRFREDLLYRLAVFPLQVPALSQRDGDAVLLAEHFLAELNRQSRTAKRLSRCSIEVLKQHAFPGNVRELRNALHRAHILASDVVELSDGLQLRGDRRPTLRGDRLEVTVGTSLEAVQREVILATLRHFDGDKPRAADALGISLKTLYNRLELYQAKT